MDNTPHDYVSFRFLFVLAGGPLSSRFFSPIKCTFRLFPGLSTPKPYNPHWLRIVSFSHVDFFPPIQVVQSLDQPPGLLLFFPGEFVSPRNWGYCAFSPTNHFPFFSTRLLAHPKTGIVEVHMNCCYPVRSFVNGIVLGSPLCSSRISHLPSLYLRSQRAMSTAFPSRFCTFLFESTAFVFLIIFFPLCESFDPCQINAGGSCCPRPYLAVSFMPPVSAAVPFVVLPSFSPLFPSFI